VADPNTAALPGHHEVALHPGVGWAGYMAEVRHGPCPSVRRASASVGRAVPSARDRRACCVLFQDRDRQARLLVPSARRPPAASAARRLRLAETIHREVALRKALDLRRTRARHGGIPAGLPQVLAPIPACLQKGLMPREKGVGSLAAGLPAGRFPRRLICLDQH
jgi:hypothetical protein